MNKPVSKLFKLKRWLTLPETARHLTGLCGEEVTEADILRLVLDGHLKLSVNFVQETWAAPCKLACYPEDKLRVAIANKSYPEELNWRENPRGMELASLKIGEDKFLNSQDKEWVSLSGLYSLPMIDGDWLAVEQKWRSLTGNHEVMRPGYYGTFLEDDNKTIYRLKDGINFSEYQAVYKPKQNELRRHIANNNISKDNAETLLNLLEEERETFLKENHRATLPQDSALVVRTEALRELEQFLSDTAQDKEISTKTHKSTEINAQKREQILGAALSVLASWPNECKSNSGKIQATKIRELIENKGYFFWRENGEPPLATSEIEKLIRLWLNKTGE